jgi:hypothetical protein
MVEKLKELRKEGPREHKRSLVFWGKGKFLSPLTHKEING